MEIKDFNKVVLEYYDSIIGTYDMLVKYYKDEIREYLSDNEDGYDYISNTIDLLKKLANGLENGVIDKDDLIVVDFIATPRGDWLEYHKLVRKEVK